MGVITLPDSAYGKELAKWEKPYVFAPFPARLYKATRNAKGQVAYEGQTAKDDVELRNLQSRGFVAGGQGEALKALEAQEHDIKVAAAERVYGERGMSEKARAEAAAIDDSTDQHVPEIPATPIKPRRARPKSAPVA